MTLLVQAGQVHNLCYGSFGYTALIRLPAATRRDVAKACPTGCWQQQSISEALPGNLLSSADTTSG
jgi:hypothetical protein